MFFLLHGYLGTHYDTNNAMWKVQILEEVTHPMCEMNCFDVMFDVFTEFKLGIWKILDFYMCSLSLFGKSHLPLFNFLVKIVKFLGKFIDVWFVADNIEYFWVADDSHLSFGVLGVLAQAPCSELNMCLGQSIRYWLTIYLNT